MLLTTRQVADKLGISMCRVRKLADTGALPSTHNEGNGIGARKHRKFDDKVVKEYISAQRELRAQVHVQPPPPPLPVTIVPGNSGVHPTVTSVMAPVLSRLGAIEASLLSLTALQRDLQQDMARLLGAWDIT